MGLPTSCALLLCLVPQEGAAVEEPGPWLPSVDAWLHERLEAVPDGVRVSGVLALDYLEYDDRDTRDSGLDLDRATVRVDGVLRDGWSWRMTPDLVGIDTRYGLEEFWARWQPKEDRLLRYTLGLFKVPGGLEYGIYEEDLSFVGYGFNAYHSGRTDWGAMAEGEYREGLLCWEAAATVGEGFDPIGQDRDEPQLYGRVMSYPLRRPGKGDGTSGLFVGASFAWTDGYDSELDVVGPLRIKYFDTSRLDADSSRWMNLHAGWDAGSVRFLAETGRGSLYGVDVPAGGEQDLEGQIDAWQASLAWMVTGETYDSRPYRRQEDGRAPLPARPAFGPDAKGGSGAWEIAARYANSDIDRDFFNFGLTSYAVSSQEFRTFSLATSWFPSSDLRVVFQVVRTLADDDIASLGGGGRDTSFVVRLQWSF